MPVGPVSTISLLAVLAIVAPVSAQTRAELLPESTVPTQAARLLDTKPVPRAQLLDVLQRLGRPSNPSEARAKGLGESGRLVQREAESRVSEQAARRLAEILRQPPGREEILHDLAETSGGRKQLDDARRRGAPIPPRPEPRGTGRPTFFDQTSSLVDAVLLEATPGARADVVPASRAAVSYSLNVLSHETTDPYGSITFSSVQLTGTMVRLPWQSGGCANLYFQIPESGWYVFSMTGVVNGKVTVEATGPYGGHLDEWTYDRRGYNVVQFPRLMYFGGVSKTGTTASSIRWCSKSGTVLFASVHVHSL